MTDISCSRQYLFPLVVKKVLAERTGYVPTERDRDQFNHIEDFLAIDPFGPEVRLRRSPWTEVQSKIRGLGFERSLRNAILYRLGTHDLSRTSITRPDRPGASADQPTFAADRLRLPRN